MSTTAISSRGPTSGSIAATDEVGPYQVEHDDLFAAIRANHSYNEVDNGAASTLTAIMGRMATYSGKEVDWDAALNSQVDLSPQNYAWDADPRMMPLADGSYPVAIPGVTKAV